MDFGARPALGHSAPSPDTALRLTWFERSSIEHGSAAEGESAESEGLLDRLREANGLVYSGEGDQEL